MKQVLYRITIVLVFIFFNFSNILAQQIQGVPRLYIQLSDYQKIKDITKETKLDGIMRIENANGSEFPTENLYNGNIRINGRGNSSWSNSKWKDDYKRSYSIDLVDRVGKKKETPLLGMPESADWILYASHFDKSFLRNYFSYEMFRAMGHWAARSWFVELYVNGEYRGLYSIMENIRNEVQRAYVKGRGFIIEQNYPQRLKRENAKYITSSRIYNGRYYDDIRTADSLYFGFEYPKDSHLIEMQKKYIKNYIADFETALYGTDFKDPDNGYQQYIDVQSFADWYIISELGGDWDHCYFLSSCYLSKPQDEKMKMGPVWDFDVGYKTSQTNISARLNVPWINRLWEDDSFSRLVFERCIEILPLMENLIKHIEDVATELNRYGAIDRNYERWDTLGEVIWGETNPIPVTYNGELRKLTQWIRQRYLFVATYSNDNFCDLLSQIKPAIRVADQDAYDNGEIPLTVESSSLRTGMVVFYVWNNVRQESRIVDLPDYGKYSLTIRVGSCSSLPSDTLYIKRLASVTVSEVEHQYDGAPKSVTVATDPPMLPVRVTYNGSETPPVQIGTYRIVAEIDDEMYKGKQVSTLSITQITNTITPENPSVSPIIYPNPTGGILYIEGLELNRPITIELINAAGVICIRTQTGDPTVALDISAFPQGMYLLRMTDGKQTFMQKVLKME